MVSVGSDGRPAGPSVDVGSGERPARLVALAARGAATAIAWSAGKRGKPSSIRAAVITDGKARQLGAIAAGNVIDPTIAFFADGEAWASWSRDGAIEARRVAVDADPAHVVAQSAGATRGFWPTLVGSRRHATIIYATADKRYDLRVATAKTPAGLKASAPSRRVPPSMHIKRLEPTAAADGDGVLLAWGQVIGAPAPGSEKVPHIRVARVAAAGALTLFDPVIAGSSPAVAPAEKGGAALAWLSPGEDGRTRVLFTVVAPSGIEPRAIALGHADPRHGRPAVVRAGPGYVAAWVERSSAQAGKRLVRVARVMCR